MPAFRSSTPRPGDVPAPRYPVGTVVQSRNPIASKLEEQVRAKLVAAGLEVHQGRSAIQCDQDPIRGNYPVLTPDILISRSKVCVEVDSAKTHAEELEQDRSRNALLAGVGWTVVRLRLGGLEAIGDYDVVAEAATPSTAAIDALVSAVTDAVDGVPGAVRRVAKKAAAPRTKEKSRLGAVAPHPYNAGAYYASWAQESGEKLRFIVAGEGSWLAVDDFNGLQFIRLLDLHRIDRKKWRPALEDLFTTTPAEDLAPVSKYPWGDDLFVGAQADRIVLSPKFQPGVESWWLTANLEDPQAWGPSGVAGADGEPLADLHPEAIACGWQIVAVEAKSGYRGPYQAIEIARIGQRSGHWAVP